jgi:EpsI family protein
MHALPLKSATLVVLGVLAVQAIAVRYALQNGTLPPLPALNQFPEALDGWQSHGDAAGSDAIAAELHADRFLERAYFHGEHRLWLDFLVVWFQTQRGGAQQPHSPKVCLPGSGWVPVANSEITIDTGAGPLRVNRYTVVNRNLTKEVLYWYQTPRRAITGEWAAKFFVVADGLRDGRTDTALVRVTVDQGALDNAVAFIRAAYPSLRSTLPK